MDETGDFGDEYVSVRSEMKHVFVTLRLGLRRSKSDIIAWQIQ